MAVKQFRRGGKRIRRMTYAQKRGAYRTYSQDQRGGERQEREKRSERNASAEKRRMRQLVVSAAILVAVVAIKLAAPQTLQQFRGQLLELMGTDTDFVAVFSTVGKVISSEGEWKDALNDAYVAVFGTESGEVVSESQPDLSDKSPGFPENVWMIQKILDFPYTCPVEGTVSADFGYRAHPVEESTKFHYGLDIQADTGTVISSFADGTVTAVGESSALGKYVIIRHSGDYQTLYAHCSRVTASSGQLVKMGDPIGEVGQTGQTTGPHLHFELMMDTLYLNPVYYVA